MADLVAAEPELLDHLTSNGLLDDVLTGPPMPSSEWLVFVPGEHGSVGLSVWNDPPFVDLVERTADIVQEVIMESERFFGAAFPPCPEHPNTPLWPKVVEGEAVWSCIDGGATAIRIGTLAPAETA